MCVYWLQYALKPIFAELGCKWGHLHIWAEKAAAPPNLAHKRISNQAMSLRKETSEQTGTFFALAFTTGRRTWFPQEQKDTHSERIFPSYAKKQPNDHTLLGDLQSVTRFQRVGRSLLEAQSVCNDRDPSGAQGSLRAGETSLAKPTSTVSPLLANDSALPRSTCFFAAGGPALGACVISRAGREFPGLARTLRVLVEASCFWLVPKTREMGPVRLDHCCGSSGLRRVRPLC